MTTNSINNTSSSLNTNSITFDNGVNNLTQYIYNNTFTPVLEFGGSTTGITYAFQTGNYSVIGNFVTIHLEVTLSSKGTATGAAVITGIPYYPISNVTVAYNYTISGSGGLTYGTNATPIFYQVNLDGIQVFAVNSGATMFALTDTAFANTTSIQLTATFIF